MSIYWVILFIAVIFEVCWALSLKWIQVAPGALSYSVTGVLTVTNIVMLSYAMRGIPVGTAYAVWTGLGAVGITLASVWVFDDPVTPQRFLFIALIIGGVVGLKATATA